MVYKYRFSLNSVVQQNYSTVSSWALSAATPTGVYTVTVDAQAAPSMTPVSTSMTYSVVAPAPPVVTVDPTTPPGIWTGPTVTVLMSTNVPAIIYYTTDGSVPTTLSTKYSSGIVVTATQTITYYAVDENGTPSEVGSGTWTIHSLDLVANILINNGAISTNTTTVNLTLSAIDPAGIKTMSFSNDDITYSAEETYNTSKVWNLAAGLDGPRTVYVKFRDNSLPMCPPPCGYLYSAVSATISLDTVPPLTTASPPPGIYSGETVTVSLVSSKVGSIYYTTDGSVPTPASTKYVAPLVTAGTMTLNYYSVDIAGNVESPIKTGTWVIHTSDMVSSIKINNGAVTTNDVNVTLTLSAVDPTGVQTMQFSNDGVTYTAEMVYATTAAWMLPPGDGVKTVYVRFRDNSYGGGALYPPISATIVLVTGAPVTTASPIPGTYGESPVVVSLTPSNPLSTVYYTTDGTTPTTLSSVYVSALPLTVTTTIKYFAVDIAGNIEPVNTGTWAISVGTLVSNIKINNAAAATNNTAVTLTLSATDPAGVSTMQFSNDGVTYTAEEAYATTRAWTTTAGEGIKTVYVKFRVNSLPAPGVVSAPVTASIVVDTTVPATTAGPVPGTYVGLPVQLTLLTNETATVYYTTDGTTPTTASSVYTTPITLPISSPTQIKYFAVDTAGNSEVVHSGTWNALPSGDLGYGGNVNDALRALLIATGIVAPTSAERLNGDVAPLVGGAPHPDGKIDIGDVEVLLRKALGLVSWY